MHRSEVPTSEVVIISADGEEIADEIDFIVSKHVGWQSTCFAIIKGSGRFGRAFLTEQYPESFALDDFGSGREIARLLMKWRERAEYPETRLEGGKKGWEIRQCVMYQRLVVIAFATWV